MSSSLKQYRKQRDFNATSEPRGRASGGRGKRRFVIQQHDASTLHYDFRLEIDGSLASWAVPKGLSTDPRDKRLAIQTENHPLEYRNFEGVIPAGEYGAGPVLIWDSGCYQNLRARRGRNSMSMPRSIADGLIEVHLEGEKLQGGWALKRIEQNNTARWLMIKMDDRHADARRRPTHTQPRSVASGRTLKEVAATAEEDDDDDDDDEDEARIMTRWQQHLNQSERDALVKAQMPDWTAPMLATLTDDRFSSSDWLFERKLDGERALLFRDGNRLDLMSRNQRHLNPAYPQLIDALQQQPAGPYIVDGEIVAFEGKLTSFSRLQQRIGISDPEQARKSPVKVYLYLFDLLHLDGFDLTGLPLRTRKKLLRGAFKFSTPLRFTNHRNEHGEALFEEACRRGWEGLIAKRADSHYVHSRSGDWLKFKCTHRQELVIGGFTDPQGSRVGFGALLLGYYDGESLCYAGKVGTGFDDNLLEKLHDKLEVLEQTDSPYSNPPEQQNVHWVEPELVAEIGFTQWTDAGRLRHPRFIGLRRDKAARDVVREQAR